MLRISNNIYMKGEMQMKESLFMRVEEVAEVMDVSVPYAYKLIRKLNKELENTGCITIAGRIDRKFFYEHFYGTRKEGDADGSIQE